MHAWHMLQKSQFSNEHTQLTAVNAPHRREEILNRKHIVYSCFDISTLANYTKPNDAGG